jgi:hypothetical protein
MYLKIVSAIPYYSVTNCVLKPGVNIQRALIGIGVCTFVRLKQLFQLSCKVTNWGKLIRSGLLTHFLVSFDEVLSDLIYVNSQWVQLYSFSVVNIAFISQCFKGYECKCNVDMCTPWRHIGGVEVQLHSFLTSALDERSHRLYTRRQNTM